MAMEMYCVIKPAETLATPTVFLTDGKGGVRQDDLLVIFFGYAEEYVAALWEMMSIEQQTGAYIISRDNLERLNKGYTYRMIAALLAENKEAAEAECEKFWSKVRAESVAPEHFIPLSNGEAVDF